MIDENKIKELLFNGGTVAKIARDFGVQTSTIGLIKKKFNLPSAKIINKIIAHPTFKAEFIEFYNSTENISDIYSFLKSFKMFKHSPRIDKLLGEIRCLLDLSPKMLENRYYSDYDRIRGYIIRNSKFTSGRRGIHFDLKYTDFEIPEYCPILNVKLEYMWEGNGNSPNHATLDRIDNSKGYIKGNVIVISRLANSMKNEATFSELKLFSENIQKLINYYENQGALESITDVFGEFSRKLSLGS